MPTLYTSPYFSESLQRKAIELAAAPDATQTYLYSNNYIEAAVIGNARTLRGLLGA